MSALKLLVLKTREYDLWSMRMKQYLTFTDHALWEVIVNGDSVSPVASASIGAEGPIPPKTTKQKLARKNELKAKSTLMLAIPDEHLLKFHACKDAKSLWEAIKNRVKGNKESKKMQKTILKQNYENFTASSQEGLDKTYSSVNLKSMVYESEIKGKSSSSSSSQNMAFVSSDNSSKTNETVNTAHSVSAASSKDQASTTSYVDDVMFSFFSNQSNAPQLDYDDLEQIDADELEEMDLKWQVAMLTMRVKRFIKKMGRKMDLNDKETISFDGTKAEEGIINFDIMAYTSQGSSSSDSEREALNKSNLEIIGYKIGLESLEARIVVHEKYDVQVKDISIKDLKNQLEEALKEKDDLKLKLENFEESSKNLTKLINSQISAKDKTGLGYDSQMNESEVVHSVFNSRESDVDDSPVNDRFKIGEGFHAVPPPYTRNYMPPRPDLSFAGLDESVFQSAVRKTTTSVPETETSISKTSKDIIEKPKTVRPSAPIIEEWDTDSDNDSVFRPKSDQTKPKNEKPVLNNKGRVTGQREIRPVWNNAQRVNHQNKLTHPHPKRNFVPTAVATKSGQVPVNAAKQSSPRAATSISTARPVNTDAPKPKVNDALPTTYSYFKAHSPVRRAFNQKSAAKTNNFNEKVNTARVNNVTTAGPKAVVSAAEGNGENVVKSSACWIWRPTGNVIDHNSKDSGSYMLKRFDYVDLQGKLNGCSRHMTGNKFFLTDYQEIDGGFVAFGGSPKGGKITGKGKIRTGKLDFEDKNNVLFTETECLVLSPDFKLLDESQVLLRVPRQNNMYSFDLKNVIPTGGRREPGTSTNLVTPLASLRASIYALPLFGTPEVDTAKIGSTTTFPLLTDYMLGMIFEKHLDSMRDLYEYQEKDKNKDKTGQNRAREWNESEKTSPSDFIGLTRNPLIWAGQAHISRSSVKTKVLAPGMYAIDVEPIPPRLKNNRNAHLTYINHLKESVETVREIVEEARVVKPLDNVLNYACQYTKLSQELVEYVIGTCPKEFTERDSKAPSIPLTRKKQVTFTDTCSTSTNNTQKHGVHQKTQPSNVQVIPSTGVSSSTRASGSKPRSNTKHNRILPAKSVNNKKVEDHPRTNKSVWTKVNRVDSSISSKHVVINSNSESVCKTCNKCLNSANHEMCVVNILSSVNATPTVKIVLNKGKQIWKPKGKLSDNSLNKTKQVWKATGKLFANVGYQWRPTGKKFTSGKLNCGYQWRPTGKKFALGELCPLTRLPVTCTTMSANQQDPNTNWGSEIPNPPNSTVFKCRCSGPEPFMMTPGQLNSGLAPSHVPATTNIPPTDKDLEILFQPMFDEYFEQSTDSEPVPMATVVNAPIVSTNTSVSTTIAQDAPSTSHSLSSLQVHPPVFPQGVAAGPTIKDTSITQADLHPSVNPVAGEPSSA
ncbi:hypothetical protein Tco_1238082 [Tanacetum coccineum]